MATLLVLSSPVPAYADAEEQEVTDPGEDDASRYGGADEKNLEAPSKSSALTLEGLILTRSGQPDVPFTASGFNPNTVAGAFRPYEYISAADLGDEVTPGIRGTLRGGRGPAFARGFFHSRL
ncbi:MAG: hypothetical protein WC684_09540, partial [Hyphomicrobium sp.]